MTTFAFPEARTCPYQPPEGYKALSEGPPLVRAELYDGATAWLVTRNADARRLLTDPRMSSERSADGFPIVTPRLLEARGFRTLVTMDGAEHQMYRRMLIPDFTMKRTRAMRPDVERIVDECVDRLLEKEKPVDLVQDFAAELSGMVIFHLLGVPLEDQELFTRRSAALLRAVTQEDSERALGELVSYLDDLVASREDDEGTWLLDRLAADEGTLSRGDLVRMAVQLLVTGQGTTAQMIALGAATLLEHPDQLEAMRADPSLVPGAVEELLRYLTIADMAGLRVATEDIELHGETIKAGDGVIMPYALLARDPSVYPDPDRFDIRRTGGQHFAFGMGPHNCLAQGLARLELEVTLRVLFSRVPTLRLAVALEELAVREAADMQGVYSLPVTW
ncbi:cytochrome P450 [Allokutzneria sp. A3M-2-11 16]|uniref:cytochrome P450 n=1 Tax=Allokutzneria sp. A3M-2-11 16 TaxID=2962043 RepID=UPI0020B6C16D|nr:cytochrome P450 [Allokutzneria sp. A3M-2-11 16]MCP3803252.1 cytochrome P450 [Allokutzneria sp. A3M-2-11 16]